MPCNVSVIVPTFNGSGRIARCLESLVEQSAMHDAEILVIDDGSTDDTGKVVKAFPGVRLISQPNAGPAAARNRGALEADGAILVFTDDDCVPQPGWLDAMLKPFHDPTVVGVKGIYQTRQKEIVGRFVQIEYEDRYRAMAALPEIDFVDTYSAAFLRDRFLEMNGYDASFPVACAEDIELSYRMSARGWKMKFQSSAVVSHTHPASLISYLRKKHKFAFWRVLAVRKNPGKCVRDSHTPQVMKLQLLFMPALVLAAGADLMRRPAAPASALVLGVFLLTTVPFSFRAFKKDPIVGLLSPGLLAARACAQFIGVVGGIAYARRHSRQATTESIA
jgi:glycosyltransferase involved in cell wall biosynthesis